MAVGWKRGLCGMGKGDEVAHATHFASVPSIAHTDERVDTPFHHSLSSLPGSVPALVPPWRAQGSFMRQATCHPVM